MSKSKIYKELSDEELRKVKQKLASFKNKLIARFEWNRKRKFDYSNKWDINWF